MKAGLIWGILGSIAFLACYTTAERRADPKDGEYDGTCLKSENPGGLWVLNIPCKTYNGTVHCNSDKGPGKCACNQGADAYFDEEAQKCFVYADSMGLCNTQISPQLNDIECTPNAQCTVVNPMMAALGMCYCLYGYNNVGGKCVKDDTIEDGDRSTLIPRTTTAKPEREKFQIPLLTLLRQVKFDEVCDSKPVLPLNRTICQTHGHTVFCKDHKCQCNMEEDAIFDKSKNKCVSKLGGWCLARTSLLGTKECIENAECRAEAGKSIDDGYSFGTCQCVKGYMINVENLDECIENPNEPNPETARPPIRWTVPPKPTPTRPDFGDGNTGNHGESVRSITSLILSFVIVLALLKLM